MKNGKKSDKFTKAFLAMVMTMAGLIALARDGWAEVQQFKLKNPQDWHPTSSLGCSISIDGNTMIAGARDSDLPGILQAGLARVYVRDGLGVWQLEAELTATDAGEGNLFGCSVSVSGNTAVVGALADDDWGTDSGSAYVFTRSGGVWTQQQKLTASDADHQDYFGYSVSVSGDTAVIGALWDDDGGSNSGSAYVFTRSGGVWTQQQKLTATNPAMDDWFGCSVSVSGDTAVIGTVFDDDWGTNSGSTYVFVRSGGVWTQQQKLTASDAAEYDFFGNAVSISGDTAVIGAVCDDDGGTDAGSAYVFVRSGSVWTQQQKLTAPDVEMNDAFGISVSVSGDTAVVGANMGGEWPHTNSGSAYVFVRSGGVWIQQQKLTASDAHENEYFGESVFVFGDTVSVGADADNYNSGAAYLFTRSGGVWTQQQKLTASSTAENDQFGYSVSVSGNTVIVGVAYDDDVGTDSGSAYIFERSGGMWILKQKLIASDVNENDQFGYFVAVSGDTAVIGAPLKGSAYVFTRSGGVWTQQQKLTSADSPGEHFFGNSVSVFGDTIVIGASGDDDGGLASGAAYIFTRSGEVWTQQQKLTAPEARDILWFGYSVSVSGDTILIGVPGDETAYVFVRVGGVWIQQQKLSAPYSSNWEFFGNSVTVFGDTAIIGVPGDEDVGYISGAAYVFTRSDGVWTQQAKLTATDIALGDAFGLSVSVSGDIAVVGATGDDDGGNESGSAYVFIRSGGVWTQRQKLTAADAAAEDEFGSSVSVWGHTAVVGAPANDDPESDSGSAYVFEPVGPGITAVKGKWMFYE